LEFRTGAWSEAYIRRIDETITALKTSGVPVFWVGLPPLRGQKSAGDIPFLNDLYRSRADKAGIIYIDAWDGFVDEDGRFAQSGPDVQGQTRRLRTSPTFPTGPLILEFCRQNASRIKGRCCENACSEDLPSFRILLCG